jgi:hypothetical protein
MKTTRILMVGAAICGLLVSLQAVFAQGTAFTYQGQLLNNGSAVNGNVYLNFALYGSASGGSPVSGGSLIPPAGGAQVHVNNGLLMVTLDFGSSPNPFSGQALWLEIDQSATGAPGSYSPIGSRQALTPTPYAIYAETAASATTAGAATSLELPYSGAASSANSLFTINNSGTGPAGVFLGNVGVGTAAPQAPLHVRQGAGSGQSDTTTPGIWGDSASGDGIFGSTSATGASGVSGAAGNNGSSGVYGFGPFGVVGRMAPGGLSGIYGLSSASGGYGVWGYANSGIGVRGDANTGPGVAGNSLSGSGVTGTSSQGTGVYGAASDITGAGMPGVFGKSLSSSGSGLGVYGVATNSGSYGIGVQGIGNFIGVYGYDIGGQNYGIGMDGQSENGTGGYFYGGYRALSAEAYLAGDFSTPAVYFENSYEGSPASPALRVVGWGNNANGVLSVSANGTGLIAQFGNYNTFVADIQTNGTIDALSFHQTSDRNAKKNFQHVNAQEVLAKVAALPITQWQYKAEPGAEHIGPMAQDFRAAFGLGGDDKHITTVDADGVALAAIQGLNQKLEEKNQEIKTLSERLEKLETMIQRQQ